MQDVKDCISIYLGSYGDLDHCIASHAKKKPFDPNRNLEHPSLIHAYIL